MACELSYRADLSGAAASSPSLRDSCRDLVVPLEQSLWMLDVSVLVNNALPQGIGIFSTSSSSLQHEAAFTRNAQRSGASGTNGNGRRYRLLSWPPL